MLISPDVVLGFEPCNHWSERALLERTLGKGKSLSEVLKLDTISNWEKLWLALRPEVLGEEGLERFLVSLVGEEPFTDDGTDTSARRRTARGAMAIVTALIEARVQERAAVAGQIPAIAEHVLREVVERLEQTLAAGTSSGS